MSLSVMAAAAAKPKVASAPSLTPAERLSQAREAICNYDFDRASGIIGEMTVPDSLAAEAESLSSLARTGANMLERVESIVVFDSIVVPKASFFEAYNLSPVTGTFTKGEHSTVFHTADGLRTMTGTPDSDGTLTLASYRALTDGSSDTPRFYANAGGISAAAYPYLMPDGMELYFAGEGSASLGGYDIFITRRSEMDGDFLEPQNLGMPYNSPWDDYLLVHDEATGIGWWASDRNQIPDSVTIYMYIPQELRNNLDGDDPLLIDKARLTSIALTLPEGFQMPDVDALVDETIPVAAYSEGLEFALPDGRVIEDFESFSTDRARQLMEDYLDVKESLSRKRASLAGLRSRYRPGDDSLASQIEALENEVADTEAELLDISNEIVKSESNPDH